MLIEKIKYDWIHQDKPADGKGIDQRYDSKCGCWVLINNYYTIAARSGELCQEHQKYCYDENGDPVKKSEAEIVAYLMRL